MPPDIFICVPLNLVTWPHRAEGEPGNKTFSGWACFQLIILLLVEEAGIGYWRRLAVSVTKRNMAEARLQRSLMQSKECVLDCLGFVELLILSVSGVNTVRGCSW